MLHFVSKNAQRGARIGHRHHLLSILSVDNNASCRREHHGGKKCHEQ